MSLWYHPTTTLALFVIVIKFVVSYAQWTNIGVERGESFHSCFPKEALIPDSCSRFSDQQEARCFRFPTVNRKGMVSPWVNASVEGPAFYLFRILAF